MPPDIRDCLLVHEGLHCKMKSCKGTTFDKGKASPADECYAHLGEASCIKSLIRHKCGEKPKDKSKYRRWQKCAAPYLLRLIGICDDLEKGEFCQDGGVGSKHKECLDLETIFY